MALLLYMFTRYRYGADIYLVVAAPDEDEARENAKNILAQSSDPIYRDDKDIGRWDLLLVRPINKGLILEVQQT